jgi:hypothetical protein
MNHNFFLCSHYIAQVYLSLSPPPATNSFERGFHLCTIKHKENNFCLRPKYAFLHIFSSVVISEQQSDQQVGNRIKPEIQLPSLLMSESFHTDGSRTTALGLMQLPGHWRKESEEMWLPKPCM